MLRYAINTEDGYKNLKTRVEKGTDYIKDKWNDKKYTREVAHYNAMAFALLQWELDTGIFYENFERWCKEQDELRRNAKN